ncbi:hypothetical protein L226DRAFT_357941 [Lentinus tigrinus ALCF2SS1-7]|uniref:uncharacterized protein n=1 Tax=Lentinus tigrinus ALCF2SS1-7 TaxID=1328758 RepID=UPI001165EB46|nr:hypothetical protein L226DRAFT_357941 [Lentinus tigrinus ALCF2SS1-7]
MRSSTSHLRTYRVNRRLSMHSIIHVLSRLTSSGSLSCTMLCTCCLLIVFRIIAYTLLKSPSPLSSLHFSSQCCHQEFFVSRYSRSSRTIVPCTLSTPALSRSGVRSSRHDTGELYGLSCSQSSSYVCEPLLMLLQHELTTCFSWQSANIRREVYDPPCLQTAGCPNSAQYF